MKRGAAKIPLYLYLVRVLAEDPEATSAPPLSLLDILLMVLFSSTRYSIEKISNEIHFIDSHPKVSRYFSTLFILN